MTVVSIPPRPTEAVVAGVADGVVPKLRPVLVAVSPNVSGFEAPKTPVPPPKVPNPDACVDGELKDSPNPDAVVAGIKPNSVRGLVVAVVVVNPWKPMEAVVAATEPKPRPRRIIKGYQSKKCTFLLFNRYAKLLIFVGFYQASMLEHQTKDLLM